MKSMEKFLKGIILSMMRSTYKLPMNSFLLEEGHQQPITIHGNHSNDIGNEIVE
jgi:hypothetical protein